MPHKNPEERAAYLKKYEAIRREERKKQKRENWLKNHEHYLALSAKRNRKNGHSEREPDGPEVVRRVKVPKVRRHVFIEDRVYFNREIGYTREEILDMLAAWDNWDGRDQTLEQPAEKPVKKAAKKAGRKRR